MVYVDQGVYVDQFVVYVDQKCKMVYVDQIEVYVDQFRLSL